MNQESPPEVKEEWRPVPFPEYSDFYQISNLGRVRSLHGEGRILKNQKVGLRGYLQDGVALRRPGHRKQVLVHKLVEEAFPCERKN